MVCSCTLDAFVYGGTMGLKIQKKCTSKVMYYTQSTLLSSCTEPDDIETQHLRAFNC